MVGERLGTQQTGVRPVREQRGPFGRTGDRGGGQLEVQLAGPVVQHQQQIARRVSRVRPVVDRVLDAVLALGDQRELAGRIVGVEQPKLAGDLRADGDEQIPLAAAQAKADPEPLVGLFIDEHVLRGGSADDVPVHAVGAPRLVDGQIEER